HFAGTCARPSPLGEVGAQVAQLVEHVTENHGVGGSIPPLGTKILNKTWTELASSGPNAVGRNRILGFTTRRGACVGRCGRPVVSLEPRWSASGWPPRSM